MSDRLSKQKKLIPISEAAKVLGVSIDTVRRWAKSGVLHPDRPDGRNRYFSLDELEQHKLDQPLSISEAAKNLGISSVTLRRLETRGLLKPERNSAGERVYNKDLLKNFLNSDYALRKKHIEDAIPQPPQPQEKKKNINSEEIHLDQKPIPRSRIHGFLAGSTVLFMLMIALSLRNIWISEFNSANSLPTTTPEVLSENTYIEPDITPEPAITPEPDITPEPESEATPAAKPLTIVMVKAEDGSSVNIRQEPTTSSKKIYQAKNGDIFEFFSKDSDWFKVKLASDSAGLTNETGFISAKYAEEVN